MSQKLKLQWFATCTSQHRHHQASQHLDSFKTGHRAEQEPCRERTTFFIPCDASHEPANDFDSSLSTIRRSHRPNTNTTACRLRRRSFSGAGPPSCSAFTAATCRSMKPFPWVQPHVQPNPVQLPVSTSSSAVSCSWTSVLGGCVCFSHPGFKIY